MKRPKNDKNHVRSVGVEIYGYYPSKDNALSVFHIII